MFKEYDIIFIRNEKNVGLINYIFYYFIRFFLNSRYNHVAIVKKSDNKLWIFESVASGFIRTKTIDKFLEEQKIYQREILIKRPKLKQIKNIDNNLDKIYYNNYNARYLYYLLNIKHKHLEKSTNCFQSIAFLLGIEQWWKIKPKDLLSLL